jgi:predicted nuclease of predicted toxin-antitoxin system
MRFLVDHDVFAATTRFLQSHGHDVVTVGKLGLAQAGDSSLLRLAQSEHRIFVTRDRDFGALVFLNRLGSGVVYLRLLPSTQSAVHDELLRVLELYSEAQLASAFVVVERGKHRFRKIERNL